MRLLLVDDEKLGSELNKSLSSSSRKDDPSELARDNRVSSELSFKVKNDSFVSISSVVPKEENKSGAGDWAEVRHDDDVNMVQII